jgi:hypothetical protein
MKSFPASLSVIGLLELCICRMDAALAILGKVQSLEAKNDDVIDRLSRRYTFFLLATLSAVVSTKQLVGEPITCWCPAHFTSNHQEFTNKICWVCLI